MMEQYIAINGVAFPINELARKMGIAERVETLDLCQKAESGVICARMQVVSAGTDSDPCIDMFLALPAEANSLPVKLCRAEQEIGEPVRAYLFSRNDTYIAYTEADTRPDAEKEADPRPTILMASGEGAKDFEQVHVHKENPYVRFC